MEVYQVKFNYPQEMKSFELLSTHLFPRDSSTFQGFTIHAKTLLAVHLAYCKVCITVPTAHYIMCADDVANLEDSCDNSEYHGGFQIAKMIHRANHQGVALFIARQTGQELLWP